MEALTALLPDAISASVAALLIAASFFTSAFTAAFGLGGGVAMLALLGAFLPVSFAPADQQPAATPEVLVEPFAGLDAHQSVRVTATGLRPNSTYSIEQCEVGGEERCDEQTWPSARTDGHGRLQADVAVLPALYGWQGRVDCTAVGCQVLVADDAGRSQGGVLVAFAPGVVAPVPELAVSPAGPYVDQQEVTVTGTGFPPGADVGGNIGQCPDGLDTAVEERCGYSSIGSTLVAEDGTFTMQVRLTSSLTFTGACRDTGCHLGWVLNHGPTVVKVPLEFVD